MKVSQDAQVKTVKLLFFMKSVLNVEVSCFRSYSGKTPKSVNLIKWLESDKYAKKIQALRKLKEKSARTKIKASLPAITVSGLFNPTRKEENLVQHSRLICIDVDLKGNEQISNYELLKEQLFNIENVAYAGLSASGNGFFLILPIEYPKFHKEHFAAIYQDFSNLGLAIDAAPKNVASLRGYSWDPDALFRHQATPYHKWVKQEDAEKKKVVQVKSFKASLGMDTKARVEQFIQQLVELRIDITQDEEDWWRLSCAFANEFGEEGRHYFHAISQFYPGYEHKEADKKFDNALKGKYRRIGIGTFFEKVFQKKYFAK